MTREEKIATIARFYGYEPQSRQCIEEMAELTQAINKLWRKRNALYTTAEEVGKARGNVIEELADVQIMIWQMIQLLDAEDEVDDAISVKLDRQIARIEHE